MPEVCIFCREVKQEFTPEHVFPAAIGGGFVVFNVCSECNEDLGKGVDNDLSNHPAILIQRKNFDIRRKGSRGKRNIRNPLKGIIHKGQEGDEYYFRYNDVGELESIMLPKYESPVQLEDGRWMGKVRISEKELKEKGIEKFKEMYAKKIGTNPSDIEIGESQINPREKLIVNISAPNKPIMLGALKIAYEFTMAFLPKYLHDSFSKEIAEILLDNSLAEKQHKYFDIESNIADDFTKFFSNLKGLQNFYHAGIIKSFRGKGLFCAVKMFNWFVVVQLSGKDDYLDKKELVLLNDAKRHAFQINIPARVVKFTIAGQPLVPLNRRGRRSLGKKGGVVFKDFKGLVPVYDKNGNIIFNHLGMLGKNLGIPSGKLPKPIIISIKFDRVEYYIKIRSGNALMKLQQVDFVYNLLF